MPCCYRTAWQLILLAASLTLTCSPARAQETQKPQKLDPPELPEGPVRNIWAAKFSFWNIHRRDRNRSRPSRRIRAALGGICQTLCNAFHRRSCEPHSRSRTRRHLGRRPALRAQSKFDRQAPDWARLFVFIRSARPAWQHHAGVLALHRDSRQQLSLQHLASPQRFHNERRAHAYRLWSSRRSRQQCLGRILARRKAKSFQAAVVLILAWMDGHTRLRACP
jgi:hypothetical protein